MGGAAAGAAGAVEVNLLARFRASAPQRAVQTERSSAQLDAVARERLAGSARAVAGAAAAAAAAAADLGAGPWPPAPPFSVAAPATGRQLRQRLRRPGCARSRTPWAHTHAAVEFSACAPVGVWCDRGAGGNETGGINAHRRAWRHSIVLCRVLPRRSALYRAGETVLYAAAPVHCRRLQCKSARQDKRLCVDERPLMSCTRCTHGYEHAAPANEAAAAASSLFD